MSHSGADSVKSIFFALFANLAIAIAKFLAALKTGSGSMMAESIHSLADCGNQCLLLLGLKHAKQPPTPDYPLGFGKAVYFWSFLVAIILFSVGGLYSIYESIHKIKHPEPLNHVYIAIGVLIFSIIAEAISMWGCVREVNKERSGRSFFCWFRETRRSELLVVFGEDLAALVGLVFALVAVSAAAITGNPLYDALGSMVIGLLLVFIAVMVGYQVHQLLVGQSVDPAELKRMKTFLNEREEIDTVYSLLTLQLGQDVMAAVKARMTPVGSPQDLIRAINRCEKDLKAEFPQILWLFFEPDLKD